MAIEQDRSDKVRSLDEVPDIAEVTGCPDMPADGPADGAPDSGVEAMVEVGAIGFWPREYRAGRGIAEGPE